MPAKKEPLFPPQGERANSATRAKARYNSKTYKKYTFNFKLTADAELIASIEAAKAEGLSPTDYVRALYEKAKAAGAV